MRDVGPICSWFVHGDDVVVAEHYDVSIYLLMYGIPPGPRGSLLFSVDPMYGASSVHPFLSILYLEIMGCLQCIEDVL